MNLLDALQRDTELERLNDKEARAKLDLRELLDYELCCAQRYRRFASVIMIAAINGQGRLKQIMSDKLIRECDRVFDLEGVCAILMGETDSAGALTALERCQTAAGDQLDLRSAVVSFPFDGHTAAELLGTVRRRLGRAKESPVRGTVITTG